MVHCVYSVCSIANRSQLPIESDISTRTCNNCKKLFNSALPKKVKALRSWHSIKLIELSFSSISHSIQSLHPHRSSFNNRHSSKMAAASPSSKPSGTTWYYADNKGATQGPHSMVQLVSMYGSRINDATYIWNGTTVSQWTCLKNVPEFWRMLRRDPGITRSARFFSFDDFI